MSLTPLLQFRIARLHKLFLCTGVALSFACSLGASASAETLEEALAAAASSHPTIQAGQAAKEAAVEQVIEERSGYFPVITTDAAFGRVYGDNATSRGLSVTRGAGYSYMGEGSVSANQLIYDFQQTPHRVAAAEAREEVAEIQITDARENLMLNTTLNYLNVLRLRETLTALNEYYKRLASYDERITAMVAEGAADESESQLAKQVMLDVRSLLADFEGQMQAANAAYAETTGHLPSGPLVRPMPVTIQDEVESAILYAKEKHPQVMAAQATINAETEEIDAETAALLPRFDGELSYYQKDVNDVIGGEVADARALVRMKWDISTGGAEFARKRKSIAEAGQAKAQKDELIRTIETQVRSSYATASALSRQKELKAEKLKISAGLLETYRNQFEAGKVKLPQIMQAENQYLQTKVDYLATDYRSLGALYAILASQGRLSQSLAMAQTAQTE
ncbi:MAG: transporter [Alphaproteobacteria bacterium]|nr:transporter [Alphaproteobacteria bacterium]